MTETNDYITPEARELANLVRNDVDRNNAFKTLLSRKQPLELNAVTQIIAVAREHERDHHGKAGHIFSPLDIYGACVVLAKDAAGS